MATSLDKMINITAESNISIRNEIKKQQLSLMRLEQKIREKKHQAANAPFQSRLPPGKMVSQFLHFQLNREKIMCAYCIFCINYII